MVTFGPLCIFSVSSQIVTYPSVDQFAPLCGCSPHKQTLSPWLVGPFNMTYVYHDTIHNDSTCSFSTSINSSHNHTLLLAIKQLLHCVVWQQLPHKQRLKITRSTALAETRGNTTVEKNLWWQEHVCAFYRNLRTNRSWIKCEISNILIAGILEMVNSSVNLLNSSNLLYILY